MRCVPERNRKRSARREPRAARHAHGRVVGAEWRSKRGRPRAWGIELMRSGCESRWVAMPVRHIGRLCGSRIARLWWRDAALLVVLALGVASCSLLNMPAAPGTAAVTSQDAGTPDAGPAGPCNPVRAAGPSGCSTSMDCKVGAAGNACAPNGNGYDGDGCNTSSDCSTGLSCVQVTTSSGQVNSKCLLICRPGMTSDCNAASCSQYGCTCAGLQSSRFGICCFSSGGCG